MEYRYKPEGVCSIEMIFQIEEDTVRNVKIIGGCAGNTMGISKLVEGMKVQDIIQTLKGIPCKNKGTSCPDQLARALEKYLEEKKK